MTVIALIAKIVNDVIKAFETDTAIVMIRSIATPNPSFDIPRWHIDGYYFITNHHDDEQYKAVVTLKGAHTLFYRLPEEQREPFTQLNNHRMKAHALLQDNSKKESPVFGQGSVFVAGSDLSPLN